MECWIDGLGDFDGDLYLNISIYLYMKFSTVLIQAGTNNQFLNIKTINLNKIRNVIAFWSN